jgi:hypothetical protein
LITYILADPTCLEQGQSCCGRPQPGTRRRPVSNICERILFTVTGELAEFNGA